jgi:ATP synthase protein I
MQSPSGHSDDLPHLRIPAAKADLHLSSVKTIDPAARTAKGAYRNLSSASVGLEMGISVIIGVLIGIWLDKQLGTAPWMMLLWLCFGFAAGFRGVLRAVKREDRNG